MLRLSGPRFRTRMLRFLALCWMIACLGVWAPLALAQDKDKKEAEATETTDEKAPADDAKPEESTTDAAADSHATGGDNALWWIIKTSGWIGLIVLVLSIYFVAQCTKLFMTFREDVLAPPHILEQCEQALQRRDFVGLYKTVKGDSSFFSTALTAGVTELPNGLAEAREAMERTEEVLVADMEKQISMLAVLGTLGPMIGLLGTLLGMMDSFSAIAAGGTQVKADEVAAGISHALLLTFEGVGLSVPAIFFFAIFKNRMSTLSATTGLQADEFLRKLHAAARSKPGQPAPTATA